MVEVLLPGELVGGRRLAPLPCFELPDDEPVLGSVVPGERFVGPPVPEPLGRSSVGRLAAVAWVVVL